jgi:hypothetical protein
MNWERNDSFYFSSQGRIFARFNNRTTFGSATYEQVGRDAQKAQRPISATGVALKGTGTTLSHFQDIHFEGRTVVAIQKWGKPAPPGLRLNSTSLLLLVSTGEKWGLTMASSYAGSVGPGM